MLGRKESRMRLGFELAFCCELFRCVLELRREVRKYLTSVSSHVDGAKFNSLVERHKLRLNVLVITVHNQYQSIYHNTIIKYTLLVISVRHHQ
jgi:hypothetical protein